MRIAALEYAPFIYKAIGRDRLAATFGYPDCISVQTDLGYDNGSRT
jgi:hypothetical protein